MKKCKFDDLEIEIISMLVDDEIKYIEEKKDIRRTKQFEFDLRNLKHKLDLELRKNEK